jgi:hypothetical protein
MLKKYPRWLGAAALIAGLLLPAVLLLITSHFLLLAIPDPSTWRWMRFIAWIVSMIAFVLFFLILGMTLKQRALGVLVNERNRYSLSRLQMTLWTIVILPALFVVLLSNLYVGTGATFSFNWQLIALLGISVTSAVSAPMILSPKADITTVGPAVQPATNPNPLGANALISYAHPGEASLRDFVLGEETGNAASIDIGRIQMLAISLIAVTLYGWKIGVTLLDASLGHIPEMPIFDETLLGLVAISHAGYLAGKFTPAANTSGQLARALLLSQKVTDLATRAEAAAKTIEPEGQAGRQLANLLPMIRTLATEAAAQPPLMGTDKFDMTVIGQLEGKYDALNGQFSAITGARTATDVINSPSSRIVREVQQKLQAQNPSIQPTGVPDAATLAAIDQFLSARKMSRSDISPLPYRMFEELRDLMP